jgi:hypothetical protein
VKRSTPIILIALFFLGQNLPAQNLTITAPNGGETLTLGQTVQINWTANGVNQKVKLQLIRGGGALVGLIEGNLNATPSSFTWTIGQTDSGTAAADTNYKIRIRTADNALEDASNGTFTIAVASTPPPTSASPYKVYQPELQKKPLTVNAQIVPYAAINSFTVNGQVNAGSAYIECSLAQGLRCQVSASSFAQPISYRYTLRLMNTINSLSYQVMQSPWIPQADFTISVSRDVVLDKVYPNHMLDGQMVPSFLFGSIMVEAKNATQVEAPKNLTLQIKLTI